MIEQDLTKVLRLFIEDAIKDFRMPTKSGIARAPIVINGYLPPKRSGVEDEFPFVLVRPDKGSTDRDKTEVEISLIVGCYSEEFDGHEFCFNVMTRIRHALTSLYCGTLANKYQLQYPIEWENFDDQPWPQWQLDIKTKWAFRASEVEF